MSRKKYLKIDRVYDLPLAGCKPVTNLFRQTEPDEPEEQEDRPGYEDLRELLLYTRNKLLEANYYESIPVTAFDHDIPDADTIPADKTGEFCNLVNCCGANIVFTD